MGLGLKADCLKISNTCNVGREKYIVIVGSSGQLSRESNSAFGSLLGQRIYQVGWIFI